MEFQLKQIKKNVSNEVLIADLIATAKQLGLSTLSQREYDKYGKYKHKRFVTRFGSWLEALEAAGLEKSRHYVLSGAELFENMRNVWMALGRQPKFREMKKPLSKFMGKVYASIFGTWSRALEWFVKIANDPKVDYYRDLPVEIRRKFRLMQKRKRRVNLQMRFDIFRRDRYTCKACGRSPATHPGLVLHVDHVKPVAKGGRTVMSNLRTLCRECNLGKGDS